MIVYVAFGGMKATTWVQIIKACLLLAGATLMSLIVLWRFGFSPEAMFAEAVRTHPRGDAIMAPGGLVTDPISAISLGLALMFGTAGLPHILMRFFTVSDAKAARKSVFYATGLIGYFYILTFIIGFGAITFLMNDPGYFKVGPDGAYNKINDIIGGTNMAAIHLANATGGSLFLGFISAVAFATILAVVAGLTLAGASAVSHDLYAEVIAEGGSRNSGRSASRRSRPSSSESSRYPRLHLREPERGLHGGPCLRRCCELQFPGAPHVDPLEGHDNAGRVVGGLLGLVSAVVMVVLSKAVWVPTFGFKEALFPMTTRRSSRCRLLSSASGRSRGSTLAARAGGGGAFDAQYVRSETGIGAAAAHVH